MPAFETSHFADRLCHAIQFKQTPLIVGLDPRWEQLPTEFQSASVASTDWERHAANYQMFCCAVIDVVHDLVPAVKPQSAFFEQMGPAGMAALGAVVDHAVSKGLLVIMDAKRGDIGSTAAAYAAAFLGAKPHSAWGCDALTVNPYLGDDSLEPFAKAAEQNGAGIYVLCKTSNPGSQTLQEKLIDDKTLYSHVADQIQILAQQTIGSSGYGIVGAVVGATYPEQLAELRLQMPNTLLLIPGFGAQGGTAVDVAGGFDESGQGAIINSSRGIIFAFQNPQYAKLKNWQTAVEQATIDAIAQIANETRAGRLRAS